jgi:hypothetical protein
VIHSRLEKLLQLFFFLPWAAVQFPATIHSNIDGLHITLRW